MMDKILAERLKQLGLTKYEIAKRIAKKTGKSPNQIATRVAQTIDSPDRRRYSHVVDVVHELGGEIIVRWTNFDEKVAS